MQNLETKINCKAKMHVYKNWVHEESLDFTKSAYLSASASVCNYHVMCTVLFQSQINIALYSYSYLFTSHFVGASFF